jgi:hypothetical protein
VYTSAACFGVTATADKCCVDQNNMRGFLEGGLRNFVLSSDRMVAFLGPKCAFGIGMARRKHSH